MAGPKTLILFDLVSTLVDSGPRYARAFSDVCVKFGLTPPSEEQVVAMLGEKNLRQITDHFAASLDETAKKEFMQSCNRTCDDLLCDVTWLERLFPDVREALSTLAAQGYIMGIYTGTREEMIKPQLRYHNIVGHFNDAYLRGKDNVREGNIETVLLKRNQLSSLIAQFRKEHGDDARVIIVGDSASDVRAARELGVSFMGFAPSSRKQETLLAAGANMTFAGYADLPVLVESYIQTDPSSPAARYAP